MKLLMKMKKSGSVCLLVSLLSATMAVSGGCGRTEEKENVQGAGTEETEETAADENGQTGQAESEDADGGSGQSAGITFEARDLEGNTVTETVFAESELTMVNVWATYCNPCLSEMPELGELAEEYRSDEFQIIGIVSDVQEESEAEAVEYAAMLVEQTGAAYPHLLLNESLFRSMLSGVSAVPTTFFVNEKGEVLDTVVGAMDKDSWKEKIDGLLKE
jgi:thiol-disulfide isomerase/thioredoxin